MAQHVCCREAGVARGQASNPSPDLVLYGAGGAERHRPCMQVIYGDTDSIMVATGAQDLQEAAQLAGRIKREVNKRYRLLEIEEDGLFKRMLLLKKKKYAALKLVREPDGSWSEVRHDAVLVPSQASH